MNTVKNKRVRISLFGEISQQMCPEGDSWAMCCMTPGERKMQINRDMHSQRKEQQM